MWLLKLAHRAIRHKKWEANLEFSISFSIQICILGEMKVLVL